MKSAAEVDALIVELKAKVGTGEMTLSEAVFETAKSCEGWPYTFGAEGRKVTKDGVVVRTFDCQGFTEWCLLQFGIDIRAAGCTSQWNNDSLWSAKGDISDIPNDTLVCLFYRKKDEPQKMAHTGFGYQGHTCECSVGVQYFEKMKNKWEYWAMPKGIGGDIPVPATKPTLRRGDKGEYVTLMQTKLALRGYDLGPHGIDGDFGRATESAVKAFQRDWGLTVDGICGKKTWGMLESSTPSTLKTVHIPHLTLAKANELVSQYVGAWMTEDENA